MITGHTCLWTLLHIVLFIGQFIARGEACTNTGVRTVVKMCEESSAESNSIILDLNIDNRDPDCYCILNTKQETDFKFVAVASLRKSDMCNVSVDLNLPWRKRKNNVNLGCYNDFHMICRQYYNIQIHRQNNYTLLNSPKICYKISSVARGFKLSCFKSPYKFYTESREASTTAHHTEKSTTFRSTTVPAIPDTATAQTTQATKPEPEAETTTMKMAYTEGDQRLKGFTPGQGNKEDNMPLLEKVVYVCLGFLLVSVAVGIFVYLHRKNNLRKKPQMRRRRYENVSDEFMDETSVSNSQIATNEQGININTQNGNVNHFTVEETGDEYALVERNKMIRVLTSHSNYHSSYSNTDHNSMPAIENRNTSVTQIILKPQRAKAKKSSRKRNRHGLEYIDVEFSNRSDQKTLVHRATETVYTQVTTEF